MPKIFPALKTFVDSVEPIFKILAVPILGIFLYAGSAWLNANYVDKASFKAAIAELKADREKGDQEQKLAFREIGTKLDAILQNNAANSQRFTDTERRLSRLEDKVDNLGKR